MLLEEDGFLEVQWRIDGSAELASIRLDIDITSEHLIKANNDANGDPMEWARVLKETLIALGLPAHLSHHNYQRVARNIWDATETLQKKDAATRPSAAVPESPGTTNLVHSG